ncbi:PREDICTED: 33 kDa ribonucleoprotein, chloroplastic [Ipomoea nil]|uniref:33 kDa ribonucleoprotein, chloroplastic n=1 Tax=Ipomoea nil TaxID=35883 RepID=UPI000900DD67|nr:PREDICTED: 33 kDa ribonucleoprotein, chloroplastic [Ipomoea nil]
MLNSSPLMAATTATTAVAFTTTSSLPSSLPLYTNLPLDHHQLHFSLTTPLHFPSKPKPFKHPKLTAYFSNLHALTRTATFCASADSIEAIEEDTQVVEAAEQEEEETDEVEKEEEEDDDNDGDNGSVESQSAEAGRLFVGNLPFSLTSSQLSEIFSEAGRVSKVEVVYDRVTGRSRGFAFITMGSVEEATEAIRMFDGSLVGGRTAKVNFPEVPRGGEREVIASRARSSSPENFNSPHRLYASNLSWNLTSQGLREAFADQPGVLNAKIIYDKETGRSRGFGFVSFASAGELESALSAMDGVEVEGRPLRLKIAIQKLPNSSPAAVDTNPVKELQSSELLSSANSQKEEEVA